MTIIEPMSTPGQDPDIIVGDASEPSVMEKVDLAGAVGFVAGTDNDTTNLSLVAAARRINPDLFVAARQNQQASAPLFAAMRPDSLLVPTEVVAHEVYAQLSTPLLWRFLQEMPAKGDDWAAQAAQADHRELRPEPAGAVEDPADRRRRHRRCGPGWSGGAARLGDLLREPGRSHGPAARRPAAGAAGHRQSS